MLRDSVMSFENVRVCDNDLVSDGLVLDETDCVSSLLSVVVGVREGEIVADVDVVALCSFVNESVIDIDCVTSFVSDPVVVRDSELVLVLEELRVELTSCDADWLRSGEREREVVRLTVAVLLSDTVTVTVVVGVCETVLVADSSFVSVWLVLNDALNS